MAAKLTTRIAQVAIGAAALVAAASAASAQEGVLAKNLLGAIGIIPQERPPIEYRERPPLMVPQKFELRPPVAPRSASVGNPNWPDDPDVRAARRAAADAAKPGELRERARAIDAPRAGIEEMRASRLPGAGVPQDYSHIRPDAQVGGWMSPAELRAQNPMNASTAVAGAEPRRGSLTEPPSGYRKPVPGVNVKPSFEPIEEHKDSPAAFQREQARRY